jgi:hypothetical protein
MKISKIEGDQMNNGFSLELLESPPIAPGARRGLYQREASAPLLALSAHLEPTAVFVVLRLALPADGSEAWSLVRLLQDALEQQVSHALRHDPFTTPAVQPEGLLLSTTGGDPAPLRAGIAAVRDVLLDRNTGILAASSAPVVGIEALLGADQQAQYGLALLRADLVPGPFVDWSVSGDLGVYRPFFPLWGRSTTAEFVQETLGDLLQRDRQQIAVLLETLLAYARHGGNVGGASAELAIHRNTLTYRLRQLEQATGLSPNNPAQLPALSLAAFLWMLPAPPTLPAFAALAAD